MHDRLLVDSTVHANVNVSLDRIDITDWLFTLRDDEYQACSKAHIAAAATVTSDGKRISINVEMPGDSLMVQHYIEQEVSRASCHVLSRSDVFGPLGRTSWDVHWNVSVMRIESGRCQFTNRILVYATDHFLEALRSRGVSLSQARTPAQEVAHAHNEEEAPLFARDIERKAQAGRWEAP